MGRECGRDREKEREGERGSERERERERKSMVYPMEFICGVTSVIFTFFLRVFFPLSRRCLILKNELYSVYKIFGHFVHYHVSALQGDHNTQIRTSSFPF